jgi:NAD(P)-dependent dehydrogenase (short-subunit alcohol dehydrogenase family)
VTGRVDGVVVAVVGGDTGAGSALGRGLGDLGASVVSVGAADVASADDVCAALEAAAAPPARVEAVVVCSVGAEPTGPGPLADVDDAAWRAQVELPLRRMLACFQGAYRYFGGRGGSVVVIVPTASMTGAAGLVPWAAVTEGGRALAKAAARAWGHVGIVVNCVAVPAALVAPPPPGATGAPVDLDRPGLPPRALPAPDMHVDVAGVVASFLDPHRRVVTGATVAVDGGVWMTP